MNLKTFYRIYYRHRVEKASYILKFYLFLIIPFVYFLNCFFLKRTINLDSYSKKNYSLFEKNLDFLFEFFNSDKGEYYIDQYVQPIKRKNIKIKSHGYSKFYEKYFFELKNNNINILEIGSFYGNSSAALFFYFRNANIYGGDINPDMFKYSSKRVINFFIDSSKKSSIDENIISREVNFDIIIEDASHMLRDQIISLFMLFKILNPGGYFIVEELDFPETKENMRINQSPPDLKTILKKILKKEDFMSTYIDQKEKEYFLKNFEFIKFYKGNINEFAIIKKSTKSR
jgi:ubiquinone/menaquinone biosynthesis C-methylase UbiE